MEKEEVDMVPFAADFARRVIEFAEANDLLWEVLSDTDGAELIFTAKFTPKEG